MMSRRLSCRAGWGAEQLQTSELQRGGSRHESAHLHGTRATRVVQTLTEIDRPRRPVRDHQRAALAGGLEAQLEGATLTTWQTEHRCTAFGTLEHQAHP